MNSVTIGNLAHAMVETFQLMATGFDLDAFPSCHGHGVWCQQVLTWEKSEQPDSQRFIGLRWRASTSAAVQSSHVRRMDVERPSISGAPASPRLNPRGADPDGDRPGIPGQESPGVRQATCVSL